MNAQAPAYAILADGLLNVHDAKTAAALIRYRPEQVVAIIDGDHSGQTIEEVFGFGGSIPIVGDLEKALAHRPNRLLIGIVPADGVLPKAWRRMMLTALDRGLDLYNGLHTLLSEDVEMVARAEDRQRRIVDLRAVPEEFSPPADARDSISVPVVLTVGSDCNIGKMTASLEIIGQAKAKGQRFGFVPTGQTGVLLAGRGLAVDRIISDFVSRATEELLLEAMDESPVLVLVEGQGSLLHPFYSAVTLGLLHGCQPDAMILCHAAGRKEIRHCPGRMIPGYRRLVQIHEEAASWLRPAPVIGIALATHGLDQEAAREALEIAHRETGLPVEDVLRFPTGALLDACSKVGQNEPAVG